MNIFRLIFGLPMAALVTLGLLCFMAAMINKPIETEPEKSIELGDIVYKPKPKSRLIVDPPPPLVQPDPPEIEPFEPKGDPGETFEGSGPTLRRLEKENLTTRSSAAAQPFASRRNIRADASQKAPKARLLFNSM